MGGYASSPGGATPMATEEDRTPCSAGGRKPFRYEQSVPCGLRGRDP